MPVSKGTAFQGQRYARASGVYTCIVDSANLNTACGRLATIYFQGHDNCLGLRSHESLHTAQEPLTSHKLTRGECAYDLCDIILSSTLENDYIPLAFLRSS
jgi:hypothetical protein